MGIEPRYPAWQMVSLPMSHQGSLCFLCGLIIQLKCQILEDEGSVCQPPFIHSSTAKTIKRRRHSPPSMEPLQPSHRCAHPPESLEHHRQHHSVLFLTVTLGVTLGVMGWLSCVQLLRMLPQSFPETIPGSQTRWTLRGQLPSWLFCKDKRGAHDTQSPEAPRTQARGPAGNTGVLQNPPESSCHATGFRAAGEGFKTQSFSAEPLSLSYTSMINS